MGNMLYSSTVNLVQSMASLFWVITVVGGIIVVSLAYVSWVKYKEEKKQHKKNSNS